MQGKSVSGNGKKLPILALLALLGMGACDSSTAPGTARVQVLLTDAPHEELDSALVWISRVYLQGGGSEEPDTLASDTTGTGGTAGRMDLFNDPDNPLVFDLLTLRDGVTADLTGVDEVDTGVYQGLRFVVDSARVFLADSLTFEDGSTSGTLKIPSGHTSGIKVKLDDIIRADEGETTTITVDFDVDDNFHIQKNPQTGLVKKVIFTPVLKEKGRSESSS